MLSSMACWRQVKAPTLWVAGRQSPIMRQFIERPDVYRERLACFADVCDAQLDDCGHNLHHDQPEALARLLADFFVDENRASPSRAPAETSQKNSQ